jgi:iron complex outermembrane receptor protein
MKIVLTGLVCALGLLAQAKPQRLIVLDRLTRQPVVATITYDGNTLQTDHLGQAFFPEGTAGTTLSVEAKGYHPLEVVILPSDTWPATIWVDRQPRFTHELVVVQPRSAFPQERIDAIGLSSHEGDLAEALSRLSTFQSIQRGGQCSDASYRGMSADQLKVLWDGMVQPEPACPNRMDPPTSHFESGSLQSVELIKGPYSVRYGLAYGGVVNVMTAQRAFPVGDAWQTEGVVTLFGQDNGQGGGLRASLNSGDEHLSWHVDANVREDGDYEDGDGREIPSSSKGQAYGLSVMGQSKQQGMRYQIEARTIENTDIDFAALPMDAVFDKTKLFRASIDVPFSWGTWSTKAAYSTVDHRMDNHLKPTFAMMDATTDADTLAHTIRSEVGLEVSSWDLLFGIDAQRTEKSGQRVKHIKMGPMAGQTVIEEVWGESKMTDMGFFLEASRQMQAFTLHGGARVQRHEARADRPDPQLLPGETIEAVDDTLAAATFSVSRAYQQHWQFGFATALGQRTPSSTERYIAFFPIGLDAYDYVGNPFLKSESMWQQEASVRFQQERFSLSGSVFYADLKDAISAEVVDRTPRSPGVPGVKSFVNLDQARRYGLEFNGKARLHPQWNYQLSSFLSRGRDQDHEEELPQMPPLELRQELQWHRGPWSAAWQWRHVAEKKHLSERFAEIPTEAFDCHNLRLGYHRGSYRLDCHVDNLLDETYSEFLYRNLFKSTERLTAPGRNLRLQFSVHF